MKAGRLIIILILIVSLLLIGCSVLQKSNHQKIEDEQSDQSKEEKEAKEEKREKITQQINEKQNKISGINWKETSPEAVKEIIKEGADINFQDHKGRTPLMKAARAGRLEIVKILIENGASIKLKDNQGRTAVDYLEGYLEENDLAPEEVKIYKRLKNQVEKIDKKTGN